jgi:phosphate transport system permease protein
MSKLQSSEAAARLKKRYAAERRFKALGLAAIIVSLSFLAVLLFTMLKNGVGGIDMAFLSGSDSTNPTTAGVWSSVKGSVLTMVVTLALAFPMGVLAAIYLEEFAPKSRWVDWVEVSINNLAAVPSIIFGLLGLAVFIQVMHLPRSSPLVGGMTLALMTMPVIVITGRNAIQAVPPSIRDAALAVGASPVQTVFHHILPLALPGILTGTIIGMARAAGRCDRSIFSAADADFPLVR